MNAEQQTASDFLSKSALAWTEEMHDRQVVERTRLVDLLVAYRRQTPAPAAVVSAKPRDKFVRLTYNPGTDTSKRNRVSVWVTEIQSIEQSQRAFVVCNNNGSRTEQTLYLKRGSFETSVATMRGGKLQVAD